MGIGRTGPAGDRRPHPAQARPRRRHALRPRRRHGRLPPRRDVRHDRQRRAEPRAERRGNRERAGSRRGDGRGRRALPSRVLDRRRRHVQGHVPRGHVRRGSGPAVRLPPDEVRVRAARPHPIRAAVARVPPGDRGRRLADRRDGQGRRPLLPLQAHPAAAPLRARVVPARRPGARRDEHRSGGLRRRRDRPHRAPPRHGRAGVPPRRVAPHQVRGRAERVLPRGARAAALDAGRQGAAGRPAEGHPVDAHEAAGGQGHARHVPRRARHPGRRARLRGPRLGVRHAGHRARARRDRHRRAAAGQLRGQALGLLGAQPRPGPPQGPVLRGRGERADRSHHRRVGRHRQGRRDQDRAAASR